MCDYPEGQLLLCHHESDENAGGLVELIRTEQAGLVRVRDELRGRQERLGIRSTLPYRIYLLEVPPGEEHWRAGHLYSQYAGLVANRPSATKIPFLAAVPNSYLTLEGFNQSADYAT